MQTDEQAQIRDTLGYLLVQVSKAHRSRAALILARHGLHVGQELVLLHLWAEDGATQSHLVESCKCEPPTVTKTLGRMERAGLVERRRDPADGRVSRVYLTARGRSLRARVVRGWLELEAETFAGFDERKRKLFRGLLAQLLANLS